jgi:uncharacterized protein
LPPIWTRKELVKKYGANLRFSASDVAGHLGCRHLTALETSVAEGKLERPVWKDAALEALIARGLTHEKAYVDHLRAAGADVIDLSGDGDPAAGFVRTVAAMHEGAGVITQAWLINEPWYGRADILRRVDRPSALGSWSYEAVDTKLARETRAGTVLQLCLYSEILGSIQGAPPDAMFVVAPGSPFREERFRFLDYAAYYRLIRDRLLKEAARHRARAEIDTYPEPVPLCDICGWWSMCDKRRHDDDHLSLVARITALQRDELSSRGISTLEALANASLPLDPRPRRGSPEGFERAHLQARIQLRGRVTAKACHELLEPIPGCGLGLLPNPDPGDVFLDLEGDPFVSDTGREYLFGWVTTDASGSPTYHCRWSMTAAEEKAAFEHLVDELIARWERHPAFHVYHYAPYEPSALKRLMGRYATREDEIDRMLRAGKFVDLYSAVRNGVRASVERYSIKDLEAFYGYTRDIDLRDAAPSRHAVEIALELGNQDCLDKTVLDAVEQYNRDDCVSAKDLRDWLERLRAEAIASGKAISRPEPPKDEPPEELTEWLQRVRALAAKLTEGVPLEPSERSPEQQACWILAQLLEWHRREQKSQWWEYFRLLGLTPEELLDERAAISGLRFERRVEVPAGRKKRPVDRYTFPLQEVAVGAGAQLRDLQQNRFGNVEAIDLPNRTVDIKKAVAFADVHPAALFHHEVVGADAQEESLFRLAEFVCEHGVHAAGPLRAARDLLLRKPPRVGCADGQPLVADGEDVVEAAKRLACSLNEGVLAIQGPPGAGKTYTGARMICELVRRGKRVGVTAMSHKVIRNLLDEVLKAAKEEGRSVSCVQKVGDESEDLTQGILEVTDNPGVVKALENGDAQVGAGTAWLWSRPEYCRSVDVLFIDEAGQMSLADVLAVSQAGTNLILLGDPQQLEQPIQGSHPDGTGVSALEHILEGDNTIAPDRGVFLAETWRLHPRLCRFTSEMFYDSRLYSRPGLDRQVLEGESPFAGAGLWFVPVGHEGNQNCSPQEVAAIATIVDAVTFGQARWTNRKGVKRAIVPDDVLIVAPYNLQVAALEERLPGMRIGTVDRFQGQEAPIVIYSMATSSPAEAPRGMEFLYDLSRLNVATSRAQSACILVANPRLFEPDCRAPRQMQLANAFCRFLEKATRLDELQ